MPNYNRVIKKAKDKKKNRRVYISADVLNKFGYLAKDLKKDTEKLDDGDKSIIAILESLKKDEVIEYYDWGINSHGITEIYVCPIMEGMKPMILDQCLRGGGKVNVKKYFF